MLKFKSVQLLNVLILLFGIGLCILTALLFTKGISFPILMMTGVSGAVVSSLGFSLILDMYKFRNEMRNPEFKL